LIEFTPEAEQQLDDLRNHYLRAQRLKALRTLGVAMLEAAAEIERNPGAGLPAPRPYPRIAREGQSWVKAGHYRVAFRTTPTLAISAVFYDGANIPKRL
jgi:plasmid stabilization system protein ParE